ncbi:hypothetical protein BCR34DRAFT_555426 [Clohesyomyces aquaticus]|uniref:Uncharacterized protein n=1 Tax=Clohesyomyces aquaticus TaxID=1231657 RepID=A0A1Y2A550_9PLEO|nr:hypothetical protein BCR34DRAFT_555426 [Clohesyomyces aquaticus]
MPTKQELIQHIRANWGRQPFSRWIPRSHWHKSPFGRLDSTGLCWQNNVLAGLVKLSSMKKKPRHRFEVRNALSDAVIGRQVDLPDDGSTLTANDVQDVIDAFEWEVSVVDIQSAHQGMPTGTSGLIRRTIMLQTIAFLRVWNSCEEAYAAENDSAGDDGSW